MLAFFGFAIGYLLPIRVAALSGSHSGQICFFSDVILSSEMAFLVSHCKAYAERSHEGNESEAWDDAFVGSVTRQLCDISRVIEPF